MKRKGDRPTTVWGGRLFYAGSFSGTGLGFSRTGSVGRLIGWWIGLGNRSGMSRGLDPGWCALIIFHPFQKAFAVRTFISVRQVSRISYILTKMLLPVSPVLVIRSHSVRV